MRGERLKTQPTLLVGVEPDEFTVSMRVQRIVHRNKLLTEANAERETGQKLAAVCAQSSARPSDRPRTHVAKAVRRDLAADGSIVVTGYTECVGPPKE